ncbi:hypothetical protein EGI20_17580 [Aquitalea sp. S1-19]|nr:hypothetical protein [Aquitalea sp. S1-19]MCP9760845.1 hypothetical protein [Aquitalea sp. S1-19]MCP9761064.1 hypothetical protein [Aquitalea sp. S1-19]
MQHRPTTYKLLYPNTNGMQTAKRRRLASPIASPEALSLPFARFYLNKKVDGGAPAMQDAKSQSGKGMPGDAQSATIVLYPDTAAR